MRGLAAAAALVVVTTVGCTGASEPALLLLPPDGGDLPAATDSAVAALGEAGRSLADVRTAAVVDGVPGAPEDSCQADWAGPPVEAPVLELEGVGYTAVRSGPQEAGEPMTLVCDYTAGGDLVVADDLRTTGTDQSVGNDYAVRAGAVLGRVDVGIPPEAVVAVQSFDEWSLLLPLDRDMAVLRLHALEGGSEEEGYDVGTVAFFDGMGTDVTAASIPIPDVVHGVPRNRGSAVDDG